MIDEGIFDGIRPVFVFSISAKLFIFWNEGRAVLVIVNLGCFKLHFIHAQRICQLNNFFHLVFVGAHHQELKNNGWGGGLEFFPSLNKVFSSFDHLRKVSFFTVLFVHVLGGSIDGNDTTIEATLNGFFRSFEVEKVGIGGCGGVNAFLMRFANHFQQLFVQKWFSLKVKNEVRKCWGELLKHGIEKIGL